MGSFHSLEQEGAMLSANTSATIPGLRLRICTRPRCCCWAWWVMCCRTCSAP